MPPTEGLIAANEFCKYHNVQLTFISILADAGLTEIVNIEETPYIPEAQLEPLERMVRLHDELDINPGGIETIIHLCERIKILHQKIRRLENEISILR